jgi:hypothetical protein
MMVCGMIPLDKQVVVVVRHAQDLQHVAIPQITVTGGLHVLICVGLDVFIIILFLGHIITVAKNL